VIQVIYRWHMPAQNRDAFIAAWAAGARGSFYIVGVSRIHEQRSGGQWSNDSSASCADRGRLRVGWPPLTPHAFFACVVACGHCPTRGSEHAMRHLPRCGFAQSALAYRRELMKEGCPARKSRSLPGAPELVSTRASAHLFLVL